MLKEPLIHAARLDIISSVTPGLMVALCKSKTVCLQQLVNAEGPSLSNAVALRSLLGLHSIWVEPLDILQPERNHTGSNRPLFRGLPEPRVVRPSRLPAYYYHNYVRSINRKGLSDRPPTVWTGPNPQWRILYKPPEQVSIL